jgi:hypothetical protein
LCDPVRDPKGAVHGDRTPVPPALSAPWRAWHSLRHEPIGFPLVESGDLQPARHQLTLAPLKRWAGTLPPPRLKSTPLPRFPSRGNSETAGNPAGEALWRAYSATI